MRNFLQKLDALARLETGNNLAKWLERVAFLFMILMFAAAPHSIAATQTAWITGMFVWLVRLFVKPRPRFVRTALNIALWLLFIWTAITSIFSYDSATSLNRLPKALLFLIFFYVVNLVRTKRAVALLASLLILSCMVSALWSPVERIIGRGVEISNLAPDSPLALATMRSGDTLLKVNDKKIKTPDDLLSEVERGELSKVTFYRPDYYLTVDVWRKNLLNGEGAFGKLGFDGWKRSRNWRSAGFYGHYTTFAEVLQLIAALAFGLFIAHLLRRKDEIIADGTRKGFLNKLTASIKLPFLPFAFSPLLLFCVAAMAFALLLTVTRGSQLGFLTATTAIVFLAGNRKMVLTLAAVILPLALLGAFFLQQSRQVGFFDTQDESTKYRQTVWREGTNLWTASPRNFLLGVGMDSVQKYAKEWHLYDDGRLPMGHFHSTPIQLLVERGLPALLIWLWILWIYARILLKALNRNSQFSDSEDENHQSLNWRERGILLGCFGGLVGFFVGGFVHYNLGDSEVAMVFFMLMGLGVSLANQKGKT